MHSHTAPSAVCLIADRLSTGMLGAYGNAWVGTPCFDHLASSSLLADQMLLTAPTLEAFYEAVWRRNAQPSAVDRIANVYDSRGSDSLLVTDEIALTSVEGGFNQVSFVERSSTAQSDTDRKTETENFFAATADHLLTVEKPTLVWLHTRCLADNWDAPYAMREWYAAEDDPPPPTSQRVPHCRVGETTDPDELLGWVQSYAAQVSLWDQCLGELIEVIKDHPVFSDALLVVAGCRGFPLGEHQSVGKGSDGEADGDLYGELLHLPLLCRIPGEQKASRLRQLLQPEDLFEALYGWCNRGSDAETEKQTPLFQNSEEPRSVIVSQHANGNWSLRTPAWFLRAEAGENTLRELYFKPDDRWEVNNLADRCGEVVAAIELLYQHTVRGKPIGPLDDVVMHGF